MNDTETTSETQHSLTETADGSKTLSHGTFNENTHTRHGAYTEALYKHIYPSGILNKTGSVSVLDIGFGIGYNILALICEAVHYPRLSHITVHSFEYDTSISPFLDKITFRDSRETYYSMIKKMFHNGEYHDDNCSLILHIGDARQTLQEIAHTASGIDTVFHDPHSPGKNSELWTAEFFSLLHKLMTTQSVLTTYSSAVHVRRAMVEAGFLIAPNRDAHFRKEGTTAHKVQPEEGFTEEYIMELHHNIKATPFHDNSALTLSRETVFTNRISQMEELRSAEQ